MNRSVQKAFTLIEMLVVISIIGILATLVAANLNSARSRARDAQRKSDIKNLQTAMRLYYNDFGTYPGASGGGNILGCGSATPPTSLCSWNSAWSINDGDTVYMSALPRDPLSPTQSYRYTFVNSDDYTLSACLENKSDTNAVEELDLDWCPTGKAFKLKP
jgi:type II secretion system protein G